MGVIVLSAGRRGKPAARGSEDALFQISTAYLLWLIGFGTLGIHRFYLGRIGTGLLWLFTGGLFGVGALIDLFYIPSMVRQENLGLAFRRVLSGQPREAPRDERPMRNVTPPRRDSVEQVILRLARRNRGELTAAQLALEAGIRLEEADAALGKLCEKGYAEKRIRESGTVAYVIPDFLEGEAR
jgi:hypothetical protein